MMRKFLSPEVLRVMDLQRKKREYFLINMTMRSESAIWSLFENCGVDGLLHDEKVWEPAELRRQLEKLALEKGHSDVMTLFCSIPGCGAMTRLEIRRWLRVDGPPPTCPTCHQVLP